MASLRETHASRRCLVIGKNMVRRTRLSSLVFLKEAGKPASYTQQEIGPATGGSKDAFLALEGAEGADVGHREGHTELVLVARSQVETAVLYAQAAAIGVVSDLRLGILKVAFTIVVIGAEPVAPAAPVGGAVADHPAEL